MTELAEPRYDPRAFAETRGYYTPSVFAERLAVHRWQFDLARRKGVVPGPDHGVGSYERWSVPLVEAAMDGLAANVLAAVGTERPVGAAKIADRLRVRTGRNVLSDDVRNLAVRGFLAVVDTFTKVSPERPLYDVRDADKIPFHEVARSVAGRERRVAERTFLNQHQCRERLGGVRRSDWNHMVRLGLIAPVAAEEVWIEFDVWSGRRVTVPTYRASEVDDLLNRADVDWPAVLAAKPGDRSVFLSLVDRAIPGKG